MYYGRGYRSVSIYYFIGPDGELVMGLSDLCASGCPQKLFGCHFSLPSMDDPQDPGPSSCCSSASAQLQSQSSPQSSQWACGSPASLHDNQHLLGSCFYQLHMHGPFVPGAPDSDAAESGIGALHRMQVEFSLPSASSSSSALLPSPFEAFGSLLQAPSLQHSHSLTQ